MTCRFAKRCEPNECEAIKEEGRRNRVGGSINKFAIPNPIHIQPQSTVFNPAKLTPMMPMIPCRSCSSASMSPERCSRSTLFVRIRFFMRAIGFRLTGGGMPDHNFCLSQRLSLSACAPLASQLLRGSSVPALFFLARKRRRSELMRSFSCCFSKKALLGFCPSLSRPRP